MREINLVKPSAGLPHYHPMSRWDRQFMLDRRVCLIRAGTSNKCVTALAPNMARSVSNFDSHKFGGVQNGPLHLGTIFLFLFATLA